MYRNAFFLTILIGIGSCKVVVNPTKSRLFVVQEYKLNEEKSLFWFRDERQITHEGLSYFQITDSKCKLSIKQANVYCSKPAQIYDIKNDTIFILSHSDIVPLNPDTQYSIQAVNYSIALYDIKKRPDKNQQYFLDTLCSIKQK